MYMIFRFIEYGEKVMSVVSGVGPTGNRSIRSLVNILLHSNYDHARRTVQSILAT